MSTGNPFTEQTVHPVMPPVPVVDLALKGHDPQSILDLIEKREAAIQQEKHNPFQYGWEPPFWFILDCLFGFPWVDPARAEEMRQHLGYNKRCRAGYILGANRSGKSHYCATRLLRIQYLQPDVQVWALHEERSASVDQHQRLIGQLFPLEYRKYISGDESLRSKTGYIAYKQATGFRTSQFSGYQFPHNQSLCRFFSYKDDTSKLEGGAPKLIWCDENAPPQLVNTLEYRVQQEGGWLMIAYTPVQGWNHLIASALDGADTIKESPAFLFPDDDNRSPFLRCLEVPQDCSAWLDGGDGYEQLWQEDPELKKRKFKRVPRLKKHKEDGKFIAFCHGSDNPYGNPKNIYEAARRKSDAEQYIRLYGLARKTANARISAFDEAVHLVGSESIPREGGDIVQVIDPCDGRNWFMAWFRVIGHRAWMIREWPGDYDVPGIHGILGPWAEPSATGRWKDGQRGPAQTHELGWSYWHYKHLIATLEGWEALKGEPWSRTDGSFQAFVEQMRPSPGDSEQVYMRVMDSRYASSPRDEGDRPTTAIEQLQDIGIDVVPAPGTRIEEGIMLLNNLLSYDHSRPVDDLNQPSLLFNRRCTNMRFALENWTGQDGQRGATKDPIDVARYFAGMDLVVTHEEVVQSGVYY